MDSRSQEVDIKELVYGILKEWRLLLGAGCICAAALGGYKAAGSLALSKSPEYEASKAAEYGEALLAYETEKKGLEREIGDILQGMQAQQIYLDGSVLMQISPYAKGTAAAKLYVRTRQSQQGQPEEAPATRIYPEETEAAPAVGAAEDVPDGPAGPGSGMAGPSTAAGRDGVSSDAALDSGRLEALVQAYASSFKEDSILARATEKDGTDLRYVKELIQVETDEGSPMLTITVTHLDEERAEALLDGLLAAIEEKESWLEQEIGENQLVVVSKTSDLVSDQSLWELQEEEEARQTQLQESLKAKRKELAGLKGPEPSGSPEGAAALLGIRYGLLGGVLGILLAGFIACLRWLFCDRARSGAEVEARFGIPELGTFGKERKGVFRKVDRLLEKLFGIGQPMEDEQVYQLIGARVKTFYPEVSRIYVAGLGPDTCKGKLAVRLRKVFPDREIHMGGSVHKDPEALTGAAGCDGVILVVEKDKSTYQEILQEALAVENCQGRVLGCVLV